VPGINQVTVGDQYGTTTPRAQILDVFTSSGGWFSVSSNPVVVQLQYGYRGSSRFTDEQVLGVGAFGTLPPGCTGIRFRNLNAGSAGTVTAYIGAGGKPPDARANVWPEPVLAISALGSLTVVGAGVNFQHNDLAVATEPTIDFEDGTGVTWTLTDDPGNTRVKVAAVVKGPTNNLVTGGAGNYNPPAGCQAILVECIAGGGGGGGTAAIGAGASAAGGGGGGGGYSASLIQAPVGPYAYSVGAAGNGGAGVGGAAGGDTTFGGVITAKGGGGGTAGAGSYQNGGAGGSTAGALGQIQLGGSPGESGKAVTTGAAIGGNGGAAARGGGGGLNNNPGYQFGGGGGGTQAVGATGAQTGGNGAGGAVIVTEYY
jgi:hypothetical protein